MKIIQILFVFCCVNLLVGCISIPKVSQELDHEAKSLKPMPDQALVYVMRPTSYGSAVRMNVFQDDRLLGSLGGKRFIYQLIDPGSYTFSSHGENISRLPIKVEAGETYYLHQRVKMGMFSARTELVRIVSPSEARSKLNMCYLAVSQ